MIEGELVRLRAREATDAERAWRWVNDREVTRTLLVRYPWPRGAEDAYYGRLAEAPIAFGDAAFSIVTRDGAHIGACGLHRASPESRSAEMGIMIGEAAYRGRGYGTDAVRALVRFGFEQMNLHRVWLQAFSFNPAGLAAYVKAGFAEEGRLRDEHYQDGAYHDVVVMALVRADR
jgi:RimJ/RimL family protein N-acetyltransferase